MQTVFENNIPKEKIMVTNDNIVENEEISNLIFYNLKFVQALFTGRKEIDKVKKKKM